MICFIVPGEPQGKARARTGRGFAYTPEKTVNYEALIKQIYASKSKELIEKPVYMTIAAYYGIPKSYTKKKQEEAQANIIRPCKKPDADNIAKIVCDALNGIAYKDDTQVVKLVVEKFFDTKPRLEVTIIEKED